MATTAVPIAAVSVWFDSRDANVFLTRLSLLSENLGEANPRRVTSMCFGPPIVLSSSFPARKGHNDSPFRQVP